MKKYDYIFCGAGASASLLILNLYNNKLLDGKSILIIDREQKNTNDKTFCFWSTANETIFTDLKSIVSKTWKQLELPNSDVVDLYPYQYNHISSMDLYKHVQIILSKVKSENVVDNVNTVSENEYGAFVQTNTSKYYGKKIFDSRTPIYHQSKGFETHINQSFIGWNIEVSDGIKNPNAFRFMDFNIEQQKNTQFVYVLPFSNNRALVEVTRFGSEKINLKDAENILEKYIENHFGKFEKLDVEQGCIPMSNVEIDVEKLKDVINLGSRNNEIKASTGYAFKNMYQHSLELAELIKNDDENLLVNKTKKLKSRFAFYDGLLLNILSKNPINGKPIFIDLLKNTKTQNILKFLDEKTSLTEDISIFAKLPWKPFIMALTRQLKNSMIFRPIVILLLSVILFLFHNNTPTQSVIGYSLFALGMFFVGLPHGAVDHLLETGKWNVKILPKFILKYLALSAFMFFVWIFFPPIALITFLSYSAWHFGQADGKLWGLNSILSFAWGISVLLYILFTHATETNTILLSIANLSLSFNCPKWIILFWLLIALYNKNSSLAITIIWLALASYLPLLFAFGLYFIGQHSINGWLEIKNHLNFSNKKIWLHSLPFHLAALIFIAFYYLCFVFNTQNYSLSQWGIFFIFLSCISFPHTIVMNTLYNKKNS